MAEPRTVTVYSDYKSPYAYLAKDLAYELERDFPVHLDWLPYTLDIPSFLGSARSTTTAGSSRKQRNAHQWRRVRYSYMDCRRQARKRGLVIRGPQKIWDSTVASRGMLFAKRQGDAVLRRYHDTSSSASGSASSTSRTPTWSAPCWPKPAGRPRVSRPIWPAEGRQELDGSAAPPKPPGSLACRLLSSTASCSGAASTCPTSARCSAPRVSRCRYRGIRPNQPDRQSR